MEHSFDINIAKKYGVNAAILYKNFQYWIVKNKANSINFHDGRTWTYNAVAAFEELFPYLSKWHIRQALRILTEGENSVLIKGNYNAAGYDRTTWYAFRDEKDALRSYKGHLRNPQKQGPKDTNACGKNRKPIPNPKPDSKPDKKNKIEKSPEKILGLDLEIAKQRRFFMEQLSLIFRPNKREATTFARVAKHLVLKCQSGELPVSIFKDAVEWAKRAKASGATNKKGLFVAKIKEATGFASQINVLAASGSSQKIA